LPDLGLAPGLPAHEVDVSKRMTDARKESAMTAEELMTANPATVTPTTTIAEAWDLMRELDVRHLPVVDGGALVGMLSDRDLGTLDVSRLLTDDGAEGLRRRLSQPVVHLMSADVVAGEPETEMSELIALFLEHKVGAIPVVLPGTREVVGIVSYIDVLRAVHETLEVE
jgi:acetoin utilization protein AcuB